MLAEAQIAGADHLEIGGVSDADPFGQDALKRLLIWLTDAGGSDAVVKTGDAPLVKVSGEWWRVGERPILAEHLGDLLNTIHTKSSVATLQGGVPLNFRYIVRVRRGVRYGFRTEVVAGASARADMGIKLRFRAIPEQPPTFDELAFEDDIREYGMPPFGLILISGPTGSGKSTSLASIIRHRLEHARENIQTFEDPIEFDFEAVKKKLGLVFQTAIGLNLTSFAQAVAEVLRMAPDVILIGEARDRATIEGLVRAAITGHAVYSTTHTNSVAMTIPRMADEFPEDSRWAMTVNLIDAMRLCVHQRLVRRPEGGQIALREYLVFDDDVRRQLYEAGPDHYIAETRRLVETRGQPLMQDAESKYQQGHIEERDYLRLKASLGSEH